MADCFKGVIVCKMCSQHDQRPAAAGLCRVGRRNLCNASDLPCLDFLCRGGDARGRHTLGGRQTPLAEHLRVHADDIARPGHALHCPVLESVIDSNAFDSVNTNMTSRQNN
jgi:hypothetical protein